MTVKHAGVTFFFKCLPGCTFSSFCVFMEILAICFSEAPFLTFPEFTNLSMTFWASTVTTVISRHEVFTVIFRMVKGTINTKFAETPVEVPAFLVPSFIILIVFQQFVLPQQIKEFFTVLFFNFCFTLINKINHWGQETRLNSFNMYNLIPILLFITLEQIPEDGAGWSKNNLVGSNSLIVVADQGYITELLHASHYFQHISCVFLEMLHPNFWRHFLRMFNFHDANYQLLDVDWNFYNCPFTKLVC